MSQKYKSFSKGCGQIDCNTPLPPDVKRVGYLRKLKRMKRRFFVLRIASPAGVARLEYYSSEKKWRSGGEPRRSIELRNCLNIGRKLHSKQKNVIALYTRDDCFSIVAETPEDLESWLEDLLEIQRCFVAINENKAITLFEHLWQVHIEKHDLECSHNLSGPYLVALSSKALTLIKMDPNSDFDCIEFPLMSIRRCGHSKDYFFIELGRSAITGAGEIYMATEGTIIAQNMHETVLSAMKSSKVREDGNPPSRPRSASTSENSNPVATRRPVGVVAPQTISSASSSVLSNSRERCDSLPTRPKTLSENSSNSIFSALSSPHSSCEVSGRRVLSSRPHSMYEWPSFNSPSTRITSPFSLSSNGGYASSNEDVNNIRQSASFYSQAKATDVTFSERPLTEVPDEYLMMSPSEEGKKDVAPCYMLMKQSEAVATSEAGNSIDLKPSKSDLPSCIPKKPDSYMSMAPGGANEETPVVMQDGYLDMSPSSKSYLQHFNDINSLGRNKDKYFCDPSIKREQSGEFVLEKVPSLVKVSDEEKMKFEILKEKTPVTNNLEKVMHHDLVLRSSVEQKSKTTDIPLLQKFIKEDENLITKPPIPERTYKNERSNMGPPIPLRRSDSKTNTTTLLEKGENFNCKFKLISQSEKVNLPEDQDLSQCIQVEENSVFDENEVFSKDNIQVNPTSLNTISPSDQNTNFSCLVHNEKRIKNSLPCASTCSANQIHLQQGIPCSKGEVNENQSVLRSTDSVNNFSCFGNASQMEKNPKAFTVNQNTIITSSSTPLTKSGNQNVIFPEKDEQTVIHSCGDYVNLEFKNSGISNSSQSTKNSISNKNLQLIPNPSIDANYTNIHFGKPICPTPNPTPAVSEASPFSGSLKASEAADQAVNNRYLLTATAGVSVFRNPDDSLECVVTKMRSIPNLPPAFRKQMSAPAGPPSLRPELPSPGRKSSCPVTASASMIKPPLATTTVTPIRPVVFLLQGSNTGHLRVASTHSPEHSSVSSISSASDEISSNHSSPKTLNTSQNFGATKCQTVTDSQYENVVIPQRPTTSRPSSVSSEKELNYASLDLAPSARDDIPRSPTVQKPANVENSESLLYAQIDFTKSEGLKNTSGMLRDGRL